MTHRLTAGNRFSKRMALALVAGALMTVGSPAIAASSACGGNGLHRQVQTSLGACKNHHSGSGKGHNCPESVAGLTEPEGSIS
jgi:hypothetical protein